MPFFGAQLDACALAISNVKWLALKRLGAPCAGFVFMEAHAALPDQDFFAYRGAFISNNKVVNTLLRKR